MKLPLPVALGTTPTGSTLLGSPRLPGLALRVQRLLVHGLQLSKGLHRGQSPSLPGPFLSSWIYKGTRRTRKTRPKKGSVSFETVDPTPRPATFVCQCKEEGTFQSHFKGKAPCTFKLGFSCSRSTAKPQPTRPLESTQTLWLQTSVAQS